MIRVAGEQRIPLGSFDEVEGSTALIETLGGTAVTEAAADSIRDAVVATGSLRDVAENDDLGQCDDDVPRRE